MLQKQLPFLISVCISDRANHTARISRPNDVWRNIFCDHAVCTDNRAFTNCHSRFFEKLRQYPSTLLRFFCQVILLCKVAGVMKHLHHLIVEQMRESMHGFFKLRHAHRLPLLEYHFQYP